jgi:thiol-disulfide isomerase/thioredoxin
MLGNVGLQMRLFLFALLGLWLTGCMEAKPPKTPGETGQKVELKLLTTEEILARVAAEKGKIVVVDVWASWCKPCVAEFPKLLVLDQDYGKQGVVCMSVSIDEAKTHKAALNFLQKQGSVLPNFRVADGDVWGEKFEIKFIPAILVFQDGKLLKKFDSYDELTPFLRELLSKKTA